jgi:sialidase-1
MDVEKGRRIFVQAGEPIAMIGGMDARSRREGDALVVLPDERWGNPVFAKACLSDGDFHIHARLTLDELAGTGASVLLGGHYHYAQSRPEGNYTFRISLDEDTVVADKTTLDRDMHIVHGRSNPRQHWNLEATLAEKAIVGVSGKHIQPGKPFAIDIVRQGDELTFQIDGQDIFRTDLSRGDRIDVGRCGDSGWPIIVGLLPGHGTLRIHDFWAQGTFPEPVFPTSDVFCLNTHGYTHYRIPSLCQIPGGPLLAFIEARLSRLSRTWEWEGDWVKDEIHCVMKVSHDHGQTWSEQQTVIDRGITYEARGPAPVYDVETGELFLFTGPSLWMISSNDQGRTWSEPRSLAEACPAEFWAMRPGVGNCAIQLRHGPHRGRLLVALDLPPAIGVIYSDDHGRTWKPGAVGTFSGACEPTVVELSDGRVIVSPRIGPRRGPKATGRLFMTSHDGGATFAQTRYEPGIPVPGQGELVAVEPPEGSPPHAVRPIVFCGSAEAKTRPTVYVSLDDGKTWPIAKVIDDGACANLALAALPGGAVGVFYERDKYLRVSLQRVDLNALINERSSLA